MVTVATKLDVPIKLSFQSAGRSSILGLGDIVIPGIVIAMALRFDHWLYYYRQIQYTTKTLETEVKDGETRVTTIKKDTQRVADKPTYIDVAGSWGEWFWTSTWFGLLTRQTLVAPPSVAAASFPKVYFVASMVGYGIGMLVTTVMVTIFRRGQPALLYLVPGILVSLWLTAWFRGEIAEFYMYTEDGSLDTKDVVVEVKKDASSSKESAVKPKAVQQSSGQGQVSSLSEGKELAGHEPASGGHRPRSIFRFEIFAPESDSLEDGENSKAHQD